MTVLDCILDANWRENGIVHVLDVVKWKGQDIGDCEAPFRFEESFNWFQGSSETSFCRFWWRDTRLGELPRGLPPTINFFAKGPRTEDSANLEQTKKPQFPYPAYFIPIPYHTNTSLISLETLIIPNSREWRSVVIELPIPKDNGAGDFTAMDVGNGVPSSPSFAFNGSTASSIVMTPAPVTIEPDGLLLYTSEASYEPGTSPLSSWVPIIGYNTPEDDTVMPPSQKPFENRPLDLFQR